MRPTARQVTTPASIKKRPVNVSVRSDLLTAARASKLNLSATLEEALAVQLHHDRRAKWREANRDAIAAYNDFVAEHSVFSDGIRSF